ncbi:LytR/AlgR family response regulator transcription factor [Algoriphagus algorifonticola]|uniref:LytR/AlgR family response regulator transcription factor n=1 Tax=Algoriphagus algorifonticola TaxID=2593007 RepID=UPI0011A9CECE|nr:LytTR family DNA-binding domain-containing protein [Algoriphagus algorifonticola]
MNILIIEDENPAANRLLKLLKPHFPEANFHGNLDSIKSSVEWLQTYPHPDLIFCDIQLADGISFEIFEKVKLSTPIIFTTAYDQFAIKAFQVNAVDYLLKPIDPGDLNRAVDKFKSQQIKPSLDLALIKDLLKPQTQNFKSRFLVRFGEKIQSISIEEVDLFFSEEKVIFLQTKSGKRYVIDQTLEQTESQLDPSQFFRINRKYISHIAAVEEVYSYSNSRLKVKLKNCEVSDIIVSREKVGEFKQWLDQ